MASIRKQHPHVTLSIVSMGPSLEAWARADYPAIRAVLAETARRLAAAGCDFFACPDNTAYIALETEWERLALPGLHIAEVVADASIADIGTRFRDGRLSPVAPEQPCLDRIEALNPTLN